MKNTVTGMKGILQAINNRLDTQMILEFEYREYEKTDKVRAVH